MPFSDLAPLPLVISAASTGALRDRARRLAAHLQDHGGLRLEDVARTLASTDDGLAHRAVVLGDGADGLLSGLRGLAEGAPVAHVVAGAPAAGRADRARGPVFVFSGHGCQWPGMAVELMEQSPAFASQLRACAEALAAHVDFDVEGVLRGDAGQPPLERVDVVQPVLFAIMVSLAALWRAVGVEPAAVVGHSQGEIAAAHVAGALSLEDAARVVALRSRALRALSGRGGLISVSLSPEEAARRLDRFGDRLVVAAVNAPGMVALSGEPEALDEVLSWCEAEGVRARRVPIDYAAHSPQVEEIRAGLLEALGPIAPRTGRIPLVSTVTGDVLDTARMDAAYWYEGERRPVQLDAAVRRLLDDGHRVFVEVSPHPVLTTGIQESIDAAAADPGEAAVVATLRRDQGGQRRFMTSLAELHARGAGVTWERLFDGAGGELLELPGPGDAAGETGPGAPAPTFADRVRSSSAAGRQRLVGDLVVAEVAAVLGLPSPAAVDETRSFKEAGIDSAAAIEVRNRLVQAMGLPLPTTLLFDHASPRALATRLIGELTGERDDGAPPPAVVRAGEPIAIVGIGCRYPGEVRSAEDLWELVSSRRDAIGEFPTDRGWDLERLFDPEGRPGTTYVRHGGFIYDAPEFDAEHFSISPREALSMDPHQRLLLECAWEALEDAGIDPLGLRGSQTGVFAGIYGLDYGPRMHEGEARTAGYGLTGTLPAVVSGRVAYVLGLQGPAISIDTACSSSLVALHLACQALRSGECDLALAGGATVMSSPGIFVDFARQRGLSPDGRCRAYGAGANGTGFSDGVGVLVLMPLSVAQEQGHRVLAVIRGSAINQDGASNGLTAPSGTSQERVIRQAVAGAGLGLGDVDAVEGHGTGTELGDPIEAGALLATYGRRDDGPVWLGSLKSNIGHTQAAAGVGGVIKMVMALRHELLPATLYAEEPSPHVDWASGQVRPLAEPVAWPRGERPRRAGISSFGISGTNAHLVLEEAPVAPRPPVVAPRREGTPPVGRAAVLPFIVSGSTDAALAAQAGRVRELAMAHPQPDPLGLAGSLALGRARLTHRAIVLAPGLEALAQQLAAVERGEAAADGVVHGVARREPRVGFVFPGQGGQWPGMALDLVAQSPVFAEHMEACARAIAPHVEFDLMGVLRGEPGQPTLERIEVVQPALFAVMVSLAALWRSFGVEPAAVAGHSQGEIAAAHIAGGLSLEDAARIVCVRSRCLAEIEGGGGMMAVALPARDFEERAKAWSGRITIAAVNGPASLVVSGDPEALDELERGLEADGIWRRRIGSTVAGHSPHVEVAREEMLSALADVAPRPSDVPVYSTVTGELAATEAMGAEHWYRNLRQTVQFEPAVRALAAAGVDVLIEIGPHPVLTAPALEILESEREGGVAALGTLRRDEGGLDRFVAALAEAHVQGVPVDWEPLLAGAERVELAPYPFQRSRYWLSPGGGRQDAGALGQAAAEHPLLGAMVPVAGGGGLLLTGRLSLESQPWLADHAALGTVLLPGTAFLELALHAAAQTDTPVIEELTLAAPLTFGEDADAVALQVTVSAPDDGGRRRVAVWSRPDGGDAEWTEHASGTLVADEQPAPRPAPRPIGAREIDPEDAYARLLEAGYEYGPAFQGLRSIVRAGSTMHAEVALAEDQEGRAQDFGIHPALSDAALHAAMLAGLDGADDGPPTPEIPFSFAGVRLHQRGASALRVEVSGGQRTWRILATDPDGAPVWSIDALQTRPLDASRLVARRGDDDGLFAVEWSPLPEPPPAALSAAVLGEHVPLEDAGDAAIARFADLDGLLAAIAAGEPAPEAVFVGVDADDGPLPEGAHRCAARVLEQLQAWLAAEPLDGVRLVVVTHRALAVERERPDLRQAPVPGLLRSAHSEHPGRFALIDTDGGGLPAAALAAALASGEPEIALRDGALLVPRLQRFRGDQTLATPPGEPHWCVSVQTPGTLEGLRVARHPRAGERLAADEVRVAIHAAGINFRDVGVTLGLLDGGPDMQIGYEGAGIVTEVGAAVADLAPGDRVMGLIPHAFGPVATADRRHLAKVPDGWSSAQAASVPLVFLTAYYGLVDLAALKAGDAVLIHGAAGGVGMAAVQIARHLGAEVFATAHPRKWDTLTGLGLDADHIASSRTAEFEEAFLRSTGGRGVDIVLDSLAGPLVDASLRLMPRGGRFIEMGKTDIRDPDAVARDHPGVAYQAFDLRETPPERIGEMLAEIVDRFELGVFAHLPIDTWDVRRAPAAFRVLRDSTHTGKLVFRVPQPAPADGTVLVTGGTGGLGALLARHLVEREGARRLLLVSRRGEAAAGAAELTAELTALGCHVDVAACDVADRAALEQLLAGIPAQHPLTRVVHAAGVLDDGVVTALDGERLRRVMTPKLDAALHLHELTRDLELSEFVLFSSAAAAVGSPGQANYAAANAFLDALAAARRAEGLPAVSLAFGLWERITGMSEHLATGDGLRAGPMDMLPLPDELGLELIDRARQADEPLLAPMLLDLGKLGARARAGVLPSIFSALVRTPSRSAAGKTSLARTLAAAPEAERERIALEVVRAQAAAVLGHASPEAIVEDRAFKELGFDSLSAVELRNRIAAATGLTLPATLVFDYPTPIAVARLLLDRVEDRGADDAVALVARAADEPIAIVGIGCRYPGGIGSAQDLWDLVASGGDGIGEFPSDRGWDLERLVDLERIRTGTSYVRHGGFVYDAPHFDAEHFSISPREALAMDPQQRLLLETAWETLEDAGIDPLTLRGSATGVFVGAYASDYGVGVEPPDEILGMRLTGSVTSVISGRVAYVLGLEGPAVTIDTACSSSLVSLHLACQALRAGECEMALAGGVCVLATPMPFVEFSRQGGLSPDGRCRAFSADADGTGFSEGAGLVALMPLSVAQERGHEVLAVIRGSAINQDGASNGLSAPSGPSQERVIRRALANAGLGPDDVDAVEAHGTGTELGDPIEAGALMATYGRRSDGPLWLGSLKSNIGHTQTAAGVGGVIKMVMAMRHELLPPTLHAEQPSPHIDWSEGAVRLLTESRPWPRGERPRRAGVSSFGISGTNAHLLVEEAPQPEPAPAQEPEARPGVLPFLLSGSSAAALEAQAGRLRAFVESAADLDPVAVADALARDRAHLLHRAVVVARGLGDLVQKLRALERGEDADGVVRGVARREARVGFVFPGQGGQWAGMAVELLEQSPVFAERMRACAAALAPHVDFDLLGVVRGEPRQPTLERIEVVQPVLFAIMVSLAELWRSFGVTPAAVVGHSQGEIAAAHVAGGLSLEDAARIVAVRSRCLAQIEGAGGMLAVALPADAFAQRARELDGRVTVAAVNGPASLIVSGDAEALDTLQASLEADHVWSRRIASTVAGHSPHVEVAREELLAALASVAPGTGDIPLYSTVSGALAATETMDAEHWYRNLRQTVEFAQAVRAMGQDGVRTLIEISPHPVLTAAVADTMEAAGIDPQSVQVMGSLRRDEGGLERFVGAVAEAHVGGVGVDWTALLGVGRGARVGLPTYAFQRRRYWLEARRGEQDAQALGLAPAEHPLLRATLPLGSGEGFVWTGRLSLADHPWLADHAVMGKVVVPAGMFLELALHAAAETDAPVVEALTMSEPLVLEAGSPVALQLGVARAGERGRREVAIYARPESPGEPGADWTRHAVGTLIGEPHPGEPPALAWPADGDERDPEIAYAQLAEAGYDLGPAFRGLERAVRDGDALHAEAALGEDAAGGHGFDLHPALLEAALQAMALAHADEAVGGAGFPFAFSGVRLHRSGAASLHARLTPAEDAWSVVATDADGAPVLSIDAVRTRTADAVRPAAAPNGRNALFAIAWTAVAEGSDRPGDARIAVLGAGPPIEASGAPALERYDDVEALADAVAAGAQPPGHALVIVASPEGDELIEDTHALTERVLELLQAWLAVDALSGSRLVIVTHRAVAAADGERPDLVQAPLAGLLRAAASEHPGRFGLIDVDGDERSTAALPAALSSGEPELALRQGTLLAPRVRRFHPDAPTPADPASAPGTVLITGGTTGLGATFARRLAERHGVRHLLLVSRRGAAAPGVDQLVAELHDAGCAVEVAACDVTDRAALERLIVAIPADRPLTAVVHAAAALDDGVLTAMDGERLRRVMRPKIDAAIHLHELTRELPLSEFILFSSAAACLGSPGQGNYAAANACLDALAAARQAEGLPALALAFGFWERVTELTQHLTTAEGRRAGPLDLLPMSDELGLDLIDTARMAGQPMLAPMRLDLANLAARARAGILPPVLSDLVRVRPRRLAAVAGGESAAGKGAGDGHRLGAEAIRAEIAASLGYTSPAAVDPHLSFLELGFDSLVSLELRKRLQAATGLVLPATVMFDHPTPAALIEHLQGQLGGAPSAGPASDAAGANGNGNGGGANGTLTAMFRRAVQLRKLTDGVAIAEAAARLRPRFGVSHSEAEAPAVIPLAAGEDEPVVFCIPSLIASSGPHEYARLAKGLTGRREVVGVPVPGFAADELLPSMLDAVAGAQAAAIKRHADGRPVALVGFSTGGLLAYAVAAECAREGIAPAAVVMIDSYTMDTMWPIAHPVFDRMLEGDGEHPGVDDHRLMAMGAYLGLLSAWTPEAPAAPTLLLKAADPVPGVIRVEDWRASWPLWHTAVDVPGTHLTILEDHAPTTARAIDDWLARLPDAGPTRGRPRRAENAIRALRGAHR
ncbi:MAG TPA: SDR family NAD(P)-dependent oxidoreductase [Baekduia sp.]|nr:SDR family NAD(P)-dependent oxidoreductase [Baekduia sp.]